MVTVQITLPEDLASAASDFGLLDSNVLSAMLREEIRQRRISGLGRAMATMSDGLDAMTPEEIEDELRNARSARHNAVGT